MGLIFKLIRILIFGSIIVFVFTFLGNSLIYNLIFMGLFLAYIKLQRIAISTLPAFDFVFFMQILVEIGIIAFTFKMLNTWLESNIISVRDILFSIAITMFHISTGTIGIINRGIGFNSQNQRYIGLAALVRITTLIVPVICLGYLFDIAWYWLAIGNFLFGTLFSEHIAIIYCSVFGIKSEPIFNYETKEYSDFNSYLYDTLLTFVIAIVLFISALYIYPMFD